MLEIIGDIWKFHDAGHWAVVTTNGTLCKDGSAVMGRGVALQAKNRFPELPYKLAVELSLLGNEVFVFDEYHIVTFPTKHNWRDKSDLGLIENSAIHLAGYLERGYIDPPVCMVRPGCGNGGLDWGDVKTVLETYLDDRFVIVENRSWRSELC